METKNCCTTEKKLQILFELMKLKQRVPIAFSEIHLHSTFHLPNLKNQLDSLPTSFEKRKSIRTFSSPIKEIKKSVEVMKTNLEEIMIEKVCSSTLNTVTKRHSNLPPFLKKLETEVNSLDLYGQLSQLSFQIPENNKFK